jgi:hypothetical protein
MKNTVIGKFEVKSTPLPVDEFTQVIGAMRMIFQKTFSGALDATGTVSMMGMMNQDLGSGAYVALEKITGSLDGHKGSFCLQHSSSMSRGKPTQSVKVVPDSGTEELKNISGEMSIDIVEGQHFYTFTYEL